MGPVCRSPEASPFVAMEAVEVWEWWRVDIGVEMRAEAWGRR